MKSTHRIICAGVFWDCDLSHHETWRAVTPEGTGVLKIGKREFEAYPLPDYAKLIDEDYKLSG